jgi:hypothetical protein
VSRDHELALDVAHNRTDVDVGLPPHITRLDLVGRVAGAGLDTTRAGEVVDDLVDTDHLFAWDWGKHDDRDSDRTLLAPVEQSRLREWARREGQRDQPHQALVGQLNTVLLTIDNDD